MPTATTYTADLSICSQICRVAVQEFGLTDAKNVDVDIEHAMDNYEPWFVRLQPKMTVPVMDYEGELIGDSKDILYFLAAKLPGADLYPEAARTQIDEFVTQFYQNFLFVGVFTFGHLLNRGDDLKDFILHAKTDVTQQKLKRLADEQEFAEVAQRKLAEVEQRDFTRLADPAFLARADEGIQGMLSELEATLSDGRSFICGMNYTLADVVATALLARVHFINETQWFTADITRYWETMQARPSFVAANVCSTWDSTLMAAQFTDYVTEKKKG